MGLKSVYQTSQIAQTTNIRDDGTAETREAILSKLLSCHGKTEAPTETISPSWNQLTSLPGSQPSMLSRTYSTSPSISSPDSGEVTLVQLKSTFQFSYICTINPFIFTSQGRSPVSSKEEVEALNPLIPPWVAGGERLPACPRASHLGRHEVQVEGPSAEPCIGTAFPGSL